MDNPTDQKEKKVPWYYRTSSIVIGLLCIGPLALPLVWASPAIKKAHKIIISITVIVLTIWFVKASIKLYKVSLEHLQQLQDILNQ